MAYPKRRAPTSLSGESVGVFLCVPTELIPHVRGALWGLQYNYAYVPGVGDVDASRRAFVDMIGEIDMSCCQAIADCIEGASGDSPTEGQKALLDALRDVLRDEGLPTMTNGTTDDVLNNPPTVIGNGCDADKVFGQVTQIVDLFHDVITDMLEQLEAATNTAKQASLAMRSIPGLTELTLIDEALDLVVLMTDVLKTGYEAAYTLTLRNRYRCDLHCIAMASEGCELTWGQVAQYFADVAVRDITTIDVDDVVDFMLTGTFSGEEYAHALHWFVAAMWSLGTSVFGVNLRLLQRLVASFANDPDPDHATLCLDCQWERVWDFTIGDGGWMPRRGAGIDRAVWVIGTGWRSNSGNTFARDEIIIQYDTGTPFVADTVEIEFATPSGSNPVSNVRDDHTVRSSQPVSVTVMHAPPGGINISTGRVVLSNFVGGGDLWDAVITRVTVRGSGTNPF